MSEVYSNVTLCVKRNAGPASLKQPLSISSDIRSVPSDHVLIQVDKFGWSANNVTYGVLGEDAHFRYFDFHPAPKTNLVSPGTHGVIPVWGFGTVIESKVSKIRTGERVFGYFAPSKYLLLQIDPNDINAYNFYVARPHMPADRRPYNQITRCSADALYASEEEEAIMLYRPLFWTSFWCEDWLNSLSYKGANTVIISSASSKTGFCLALVIKKRLQKTGERGITLIGLTSPSNLNFVRSLELFNKVLLYDHLSKIEVSSGSFCYVDVAGNEVLNKNIVEHLGSSLALGVTLGMSHSSSKSIKTAAESSEAFEMFFMPKWMQAVRQKTPVSEISRRQAEGWRWIMEDGKDWVKMEKAKGGEEVAKRIREGMETPTAPDKGLVFSMWGEMTPAAKL